MPTTRRQVLITLSQLATAAALSACARPASEAAASAANTDLELLASVSFEILPYPELPPALYVTAAQRLLDLKHDDVVAGVANLRDAIEGAAWKDVPESRRISILTSLQGSPFFRLLRTHTLQVLLRDPATFALIGYGGSSIQYGGYLGRGFNDINWLPGT